MRFSHFNYNTPPEAAAALIARGWRVVPVPAGSKAPADTGWPERTYTPDEFAPTDNVGIKTGQGLICLDLDWVEARAAARLILPATNMADSRGGLPGHFFYRVRGQLKTTTFDAPREAVPADRGRRILEILSDGRQVNVPPSIHPETGQRRFWCDLAGRPLPGPGDPAEVEAAELRQAAARLAAAALLAAHWRRGERQDLALALAGWLLRSGWDEGEVAAFLRAICEAAGDEETRKRIQTGEYTRRRLEENRPTTGGRRLRELLGQAVVDRLAEWLGLEREPAGAGENNGRGSRREPQATELIALVRGSCELWHAPSGDPFLTTPDGRHIRLRERDVEAAWYLSGLYFRQHGEAPSTDALTRARDTLMAIARFDGPEFPVFVRVGQAEGRVYVDLGGPAVEIWGGGWRVVERPPVRFWRPKGTLPLPRPERGTDDDLGWLARTFRLTAQDRDLLEGVLVSWLRPEPPFFILQVTGEPGSGKSTLSRLIVNLLDPRTTPLRGAPREERDIMIRARRSWLVALSNLSGVPGWLSDALCRLASGEGFDVRILYTDDELESFEGGRPVLINGVPDLAAEARRSDLADRTLSLLLDRLPPEAVRPEAEILAEFEALRPRMLGALYERVAAALRNFNSVRLPALPRMADAAQWVTASEPPERRGAFVGAVFELRLSEGQETVEGDPVGRLILQFVEGWEPGQSEELRPTELFEKLRGLAGVWERDFPATPAALGTRLRRLGPMLRQVGVELEFSRRRDARLVVIRKCVKSAVTAVTPVTDLDFSVKTESNCDGNEGSSDGNTPVCDGKDPARDGKMPGVTAMTADLRNFREDVIEDVW